MLCRFYQWKIERQIDNGCEQFTVRLQRHIDRCSSCRGYAEQLIEIRLQLTGTAPASLQPEAVRPLAARVMDAAARLQAPAVSVQRVRFDNPAHAKLFAGSLAAGLMVLIGIFVLKVGPSGTPLDSASPIHIDARTLQTPLPIVASWPEKPMQEEVKQMGNDIERAVGFLLRSLPAVEPAEHEDDER